MYGKRADGGTPLAIPGRSREQLQHEFVAFVAEAGGRLHFAAEFAARLEVAEPVIDELHQLTERLGELHLVALVECGRCANCGAELTDPSRSPSGARHCRACRVGWQLAGPDGRLVAEAHPWPDRPATTAEPADR